MSPRWPSTSHFVVLFPGRTGSTFVMSALRGHSRIKATGELIGPLRTQGADAQLNAIREWNKVSLFSRRRTIGYKTKLVDVVDRGRFRQVLEDYDARVVVLARENHVKHVVSRANAKRLRDSTNSWNRRPGDDELPPVTIDPAEFHAALERVEAHQRDIDEWSAALTRPLMRVTYEELLPNPQRTFDALTTFLGLRPEPLQGRTEKATRDDLRLALANFDELRAEYAGTPYAGMFDEVVTSPG